MMAVVIDAPHAAGQNVNNIINMLGGYINILLAKREDR